MLRFIDEEPMTVQTVSDRKYKNNKLHNHPILKLIFSQIQFSYRVKEKWTDLCLFEKFQTSKQNVFYRAFFNTEKKLRDIEMEFTSVGFWSCGFQGIIRDYWDLSLTLSRSRRSSRPLSPRSRPRSSRSRSERAPRSIRSPPRSRRSRISCSSRRLPKLLLEEFKIKIKLILN